MGGTKDSPTYAEVCTGLSGHAEVVHLEYDPAAVTYEQLLEVFWNAHDPTTLNRQGADIGPQYRSAIFYHTPEQEAAARVSKAVQAESGRNARPIVTEITPASAFWLAEERHQHYYAKHGLVDCGAR
jgi:peptide-methionine (S)-S-oxide reductase